MHDSGLNELPIYFDYMATTPVDPRVISKMIQYLGPDGVYGNPASISHVYGQSALGAVDVARLQVADAIGAKAEDIVFTSGATEANNLAILGAARFYQRKGKHVITMLTEHKAVLDSFQQLEREGFVVTYLKPGRDGILDLNVLAEALTAETILVSIMHVNNEIGVIQDIRAIGELLHNKGIIFHVDAAQSAGKIPINLASLSINMMSFSAHKNYGPKGIGALYIRQKPRTRILAQSFGGGQERGMRAGTLATHQIVGMGEAFAIGAASLPDEQTLLAGMRQKLWDGIKALPGIQLNGHPSQRIAGNLNISFAGVESKALLVSLQELAVSTTSACASASHQPSYVLKALGLDDALASSSIRLTLGRFTNDEQVSRAIKIICYQIKKLHQILPS